MWGAFGGFPPRHHCGGHFTVCGFPMGRFLVRHPLFSACGFWRVSNFFPSFPEKFMRIDKRRNREFCDFFVAIMGRIWYYSGLRDFVFLF